MSKYYWSASARGFLNDDLNVGELPTDAVEITYQEWQDLLNGQLVGSIQSDEKGRPYIKINENGGKSNAVYEAEAKKVALATMASQAIGTLQDAVDLDMATDEEKAQLTAWRKYRVLLTRVDTSNAPDINWPQAPTA